MNFSSCRSKKLLYCYHLKPYYFFSLDMLRFIRYDESDIYIFFFCFIKYNFLSPHRNYQYISIIVFSLTNTWWESYLPSCPYNLLAACISKKLGETLQECNQEKPPHGHGLFSSPDTSLPLICRNTRKEGLTKLIFLAIYFGQSPFVAPISK